MSRIILDQESGQWVNEKFQQVAEVINDWDSRLRLLWIPERMRTEADVYPYAVGFFENEFSEPHIILFVTEQELDERLIAKLFDMRDAAKDPNARLKNMEDAKAILKAKAEVEHNAELHDKARALWRTPKHTYRMDGKVFNL